MFTLPLTLLLAAPNFPAQQLQFHEVSQAVGIVADHSMALDHPMAVMSGGGSVGDLNNDGIADMFLPSGGVFPDRIYYGKPDHSFEEQVPVVHDATARYRGVGSTMGDFDGDGWMDIFITSLGDTTGSATHGAHRLYRNLGNGEYQEVAAAAGVDFSSDSVPDGFGSCFGDYDLDGDLDLFVTGWESSSFGNRLFRNEGDATFTDVTVASGISTTFMRGFSPRFVDLDGDRYPEILVAADFGTTAIFKNLRDGRFIDATVSLHPDKVHYGMGQAVGDFDGDLELDWYVTSIYFDAPQDFIPNGNRLYLFRPDAGKFQAVPPQNQVDNGGWGWGTVAGDFDLDGDQDLAEVNGWTDNEWLDESTFLYLNDGNAVFTERSQACGFNSTGQGRGLVSFDYQNDGDLDLFVFGPDEPVRLYRNDLQGNRRWLRVDVDTSANPNLAPDGFGTKVYVTSNGQEQVVSIDGGASYLGCNQMTALFGLLHDQSAEEVVVAWADGFRTVLRDVAADQILEVAAIAPLEVDEQIHRGSRFQSSLRGIVPGEEAWFFGSATGTTPTGQTLPSFGGLQMDLRAPVIFLGTATADASGTASRNAPIAAWMPSITLSIQAYVQRGPAGRHSLKSNVVQRTVLP